MGMDRAEIVRRLRRLFPGRAGACAQGAALLEADEAELAALRRDAERYHWHRSVGGKSWTVLETGDRATGDLYDAATDAAMAKGAAG